MSNLSRNMRLLERQWANSCSLRMPVFVGFSLVLLLLSFGFSMASHANRIQMFLNMERVLIQVEVRDAEGTVLENNRKELSCELKGLLETGIREQAAKQVAKHGEQPWIPGYHENPVEITCDSLAGENVFTRSPDQYLEAGAVPHTRSMKDDLDLQLKYVVQLNGDGSHPPNVVRLLGRAGAVLANSLPLYSEYSEKNECCYRQNSTLSEEDSQRQFLICRTAHSLGWMAGTVVKSKLPSSPNQ